LTFPYALQLWFNNTDIDHNYVHFNMPLLPFYFLYFYFPYHIMSLTPCGCGGLLNTVHSIVLLCFSPPDPNPSPPLPEFYPNPPHYFSFQPILSFILFTFFLSFIFHPFPSLCYMIQFIFSIAFGTYGTPSSIDANCTPQPQDINYFALFTTLH
jgi:hypothetical protein